MSPLRRTLASLLVAVIVVGGLTTVAVSVFFERPEFSPLAAFEVRRASPAQAARALAQSRGEMHARARADLPPGRVRRGFVQLAFDVGDDGHAANIRVLGALPRGRYETQAVERIAARRYAPGSARTEIVEFEYRPGAE